MSQSRNTWMIILLIALLIGAVWLAIILRTVLTPFVLAFIAAYILNPIIDYGVRHRMGRDFCIFSLMAILLLLLALIAAIVIPSMITQTVELANRVPVWMEELTFKLQELEISINSIEWLSSRFPDGISLRPAELMGQISSQLTVNQIREVLPTATNWSAGLFSGFIGFFTFLFYAGLFLISTVYLLRDYRVIVDKTRALIPPQHSVVITGIFDDIDRNLKNFFRGQLLVCIINSTILSVFLMMASTPYAMVLGFLTGFMNIIPYAGVSIGLVLSLIVSFISHGSIWYPAAVLVLFVIQQMIDGSLITPRLLGDKVGLHPVIVIASFLIFGSLFGFFGLLLAVPLATVSKVLIAHFLHMYHDTNFVPAVGAAAMMAESAPAGTDQENEA